MLALSEGKGEKVEKLAQTQNEDVSKTRISPRHLLFWWL